MAHDERLAVVTGTSSGLGKAVAQQLVKEGWCVVGLSRRPMDLDDPLYRHLCVDLGDLKQLAETGDRELAPLLADTRWGCVGLVNNAAIAGDMRSADEVEPAELAGVFAVNTIAPIYLMGLALRSLPVSTWLRIVNVSSGAAVRPFPGLLDYGTSKAALRMAGMIVTEELTSNDRPGGPRPRTAVLSYAPGVVDTPMQEMARSSDSAWSQPFIEFHKHGLLQPPAAPAADVVRFLSGDQGPPFSETSFQAG